MRDTPIEQIMTREVLSIGVNEPVAEAIRLFALYPVHHLPVVDDSGLKGMLSSADMLKLEHFLPKGVGLGTTTFISERFRITSLMRQPVISARPDDTIAQAASCMAVNAVHALPVVSDTNHLIGIITTTDIMAALLNAVELNKTHEQQGARLQPAPLEPSAATTPAGGSPGTATREAVVGSPTYSRARYALLEGLREKVARYLRGGLDSNLHTLLLKDIDALDARPDLTGQL